jgi:DNA-binding XRE family transcriptional regulator
MTPTDLIAARKALGLSQAALARTLGVSLNTTNRWEKGERAIPPYLWLAIEGLRHQHCKEYQAYQA